MTFEEVLNEAVAMLKRQGRVSYRALKRQFDLDDDYVEDLRDALLYTHPQSVHDDGRGLTWASERSTLLEPVSSPLHSVPEPLTSDNASTQSEVLPTIAPSPSPDAERRQLTVMFCDLVGSTELSGRLDPEELRDVIRAYQSTSTEVIERYDGYIAQHLGDGLMVYFGWPQAHEDDTQRAVRAGLGIVHAMGPLNDQLEHDKGVRLAVRIGIHTGPVVIGEIGSGASQESLALGETPNVAARIQGLAEADTVVVSAAAYGLVQGYFACEDLGEQELRGIFEPLGVYRVLRESGARSLLEIAPTLTPLIGREPEVEILLDRWEQAQAGQGQIILLRGEAGIGKSRLVQALKDHVADAESIRLECRCVSSYQNTALYPIIDLMQRWLSWQPDDSPEQKLWKLETTLARSHKALNETVPLLAALLSLPLPDNRYRPRPLSPSEQRRKTLGLILDVLVGLTARYPLLLIVEDLHWGDPSTFELLALLIDQAATVRCLTLLTYRPIFQAAWDSRTHVTSVGINRLSPPQVEQMVAHITGGKALPAEVLQQVTIKSDGVPLFVEELTKMVVGSGLLRERESQYELTRPLRSLAIPTTLHDSLMARLDQLSTVKAVLQLGAVIGRQFHYALLQAVSTLPEAALQRALGQLVQADLLYPSGVLPQTTYTFKHALIQEAAYQSLLKRTRQDYHRHIAQVLTAQFPDMVHAHPELLAQHYTEAGENEQAMLYWHSAGQQAIKHSANAEAISHLRQGLEVLKTLPETSERLHHELMLHIALGTPLLATKGYAAAEVEQVYSQARHLCQRVGDTPQLFPALVGLRRFYQVRGELQTAHELGMQLLALAQSLQDEVFLLEAHFGLGIALYYMGEFVASRDHCEQGLGLYEPQFSHSHAFLFGQDPGVACSSYVALGLWTLGHADWALGQSQKGLALAQDLAHPFSLGFALLHLGVLHALRRDGRAALAVSERALSLAADQGFAFWLAWGTFLRGWAMAAQGAVEEGITQMHQGLSAVHATGGGVGRSGFLALLAETYGRSGQPAKGLEVLDEALNAVNLNAERYYEAEIYRVKGELLLACSRDQQSEAETCWHQALAVARRQQAMSLELRAAMSLSRLWQQQNKCQEACDLLAPVYEWFTEGFDTADLIEAKQLLNELSAEISPPTA